MTRTSRGKEEVRRPGSVRGGVWIMAAGLLLVQLVVLPGAASPFRTPKTVFALTTILLVAGLGFARQLGRGRLVLRWSPLATVLISLPALQAVSAVWSSSPRLALAAAVESLIWLVGALWIATLVDRERRVLVDSAAVGATISGAVLIAQAIGWAVFSLGPPGPSGRLSLTGLTGNPADLSMAAVLLLPLVLASSTGPARPWLRWTFAILLTAAAAISQTLTAFAAIALVWVTWLFQQRARRRWIAAAVTAVVVIMIGLATGLDTRIQRQLLRLERGDWYLLLSARSDGWTAAGEMIRDRPITGTGASNFTYAYYPSRVSWLERTGTVGRRTELATHFRFAHCDPLQLIAELGVPGLLWLVLLIVVGFRCLPRGDPLPPLAAAAFLPFALLHFPTHLAVGLVPLILILGHLLAAGDEVVLEPRPWPRRILAAGLVVLVLFAAYQQVYGLMLNLWRGGLSYALTVIDTLDEPQRAQEAAAVEAQILPRLPALPGARPWLWRMLGQARMARGDAAGAESAFRTALGLWPHEEAEFGLGLSLAAQDRRMRGQGVPIDGRNRRGEALVHLARVCRTNPALLELIDDRDLRKAVSEIVGQGPGPPRDRRSGRR